MLKTLKWDVVFYLSGVCDVPRAHALVFWNATKNCQTGVIVPLRKKGDSSECTKCRNPSLLEKVYDKCLTNDVPAVALQTKFPHSRKCLEKILGVSKGACTCLSNSRQHWTEFIVKHFWECCRSAVLKVSCYWTFKPLHSCSVVCQNKSNKTFFWLQSKLCCVLLARYNDTRDLRRPGNYLVFNVPENKSKLSTFRSTLFSPNRVASELNRVDHS